MLAKYSTFSKSTFLQFLPNTQLFENALFIMYFLKTQLFYYVLLQKAESDSPLEHPIQTGSLFTL